MCEGIEWGEYLCGRFTRLWVWALVVELIRGRETQCKGRRHKLRRRDAYIYAMCADAMCA